ncbi:MAG: SDR family NAD(P)-dependent oxidoreductase [Pseudomonadota bacterium]
MSKSNAPNTIVLTGASSGIGAALVAAYAAPGVRMLLIARDAGRLATVAAGATKAGAEVETFVRDVTDAEALRDAILGFDDRRAVELVIANAGIALGGLPEPEGQAKRVAEVNYFGMLNTVEPLIPRMIARGAGRIALVSSISAIRPSGDLPSYSASKAAVRAYGQAIRSKLRGEGVSVTVICPGFVTSPMADRHHGPKPFEITAEKAAAIIRKGVASRRGALTFPWQFALMVFLGNRLPPVLSDWFERRYAADIGGKS